MDGRLSWKFGNGVAQRRAGGEGELTLSLMCSNHQPHAIHSSLVVWGGEDGRGLGNSRMAGGGEKWEGGGVEEEDDCS